MSDIVPKDFQIATAFRGGPIKRLGEGIAAGFTWIGMKGKVWSLRHEGENKIFTRPDDGTPSPFLDVVILAENPATSKLYYSGSYNEDSASAPDCASIDGIKPDSGVPDPQATACGICPNNEWGSAGNGSRGKACQDHKRLAVLLMPYMTERMLEKPLLTPVFLKIPPASLKSYKGYGDALAHRGIPPEAVVTRITFEPGKLFQMRFQLKQALTNAEAPVIKPLLTSVATANIIGGMPEIEDTAPELPPAEPGETGLLSAFGQGTASQEPANQAKRGRGRPPGAPNKQKRDLGEGRIVTVHPEPKADPPETEAADGNDPDGSPDEPPWTEGDSDFEENVNKLLNQRIQGMLK